MTSLTPDAAALAKSLLSLSALLTEADEAQWQRARVITDTDEGDTGIRSKGEHGDPTADIVADPGRLRLRAAVIDAERVLQRFTAAADITASRLQRQLDAWNGGVND
jgi:hypothetical protein